MSVGFESELFVSSVVGILDISLMFPHSLKERDIASVIDGEIEIGLTKALGCTFGLFTRVESATVKRISNTLRTERRRPFPWVVRFWFGFLLMSRVNVHGEMFLYHYCGIFNSDKPKTQPANHGPFKGELAGTPSEQARGQGKPPFQAHPVSYVAMGEVGSLTSPPLSEEFRASHRILDDDFNVSDFGPVS